MQGLPWQTVEECLEHFFWPPERFGEWQGNWPYSTLLLLRRDAAQCLGHNPDTFQQCTHCFKPVLWPGALTIFAGIDLLAKFHADDDEGKVGERFKAYIDDFVEGSFDKHELWLLRNAMMHSFGLWAKVKVKDGEDEKEKECWFSLTKDLPVLLQTKEDEGNRFVFFDIMRLWRAFEGSVSKFRDNLMTTYQTKRRLKDFLMRYGFTGIHNLTVIHYERR